MTAETTPEKPVEQVDEVAVAEPVPTTEEEKAVYDAQLAAKRREEKAVALMQKIRRLCDKDGFMLLPRVYYIPVPSRADGAQIQRAEISLVDKPAEDTPNK